MHEGHKWILEVRKNVPIIPRKYTRSAEHHGLNNRKNVAELLYVAAPLLPCKCVSISHRHSPMAALAAVFTSSSRMVPCFASMPQHHSYDEPKSYVSRFNDMPINVPWPAFGLSSSVIVKTKLIASLATSNGRLNVNTKRNAWPRRTTKFESRPPPRCIASYLSV